MKKTILFCTVLALVTTITSCEKAEKILLLSNHKWVVTNNSQGGNPGNEYSFLDNRLFFLTTTSGSEIDGKWDFAYSGDINTLYIETSLYTNYYIQKLTADELELKPIIGSSTALVTLAPKTK
jgi:hypothetical protein